MTLNVALFGYGKMGHMVEQAARRAGVEVTCVVDPVAGSRGDLGSASVAIDFSEPAAVVGNIHAATSARLSMVVGTTGWYDQIDQVRAAVDRANVGLVYGSNFSIGVNVMFNIAREAARLFSRFDSYDPFIEEAHHKFKKDAPSGTAIFLKRIVEKEYERGAPVSSTRAGYMPGVHTLGFDSEADTLKIVHEARSRAGFAEGAVVAAKWIAGKKGFFEFSEVMDEILGRRS
ncbi:MAG TPA: 4-hydroxy-tetrahydrodipicolinate reductase [Blastocatellia bacterium]|nr:4-hydroxy-tetrahydrodipicolinate reductase [Blastocatellia bacterium]